MVTSKSIVGAALILGLSWIVATVSPIFIPQRAVDPRLDQVMKQVEQWGEFTNDRVTAVELKLGLPTPAQKAEAAKVAAEAAAKAAEPKK